MRQAGIDAPSKRTMIFTILGGLLYLAAFACGIIILIDAFKNEVWKGLLCLFCGFYTLYYAFVEFNHEKKWTIIGCWLGAGILGAILIAMGGQGRAA